MGKKINLIGKDQNGEKKSTDQKRIENVRVPAIAGLSSVLRKRVTSTRSQCELFFLPVAPGQKNLKVASTDQATYTQAYSQGQRICTSVFSQSTDTKNITALCTWEEDK